VGEKLYAKTDVEEGEDFPGRRRRTQVLNLVGFWAKES